MGPSLTLMRIEKVLSVLFLVKDRSSRDGTKDLPAWLKARRQLWSVLLILPMEPGDLPQKFLQTQLWISMLNFWTLRTRRRRNGSTVMSRNFLRPKDWNKVETISSKRVTIAEQYLTTKKVWSILITNMQLRLSSSSTSWDSMLPRPTSNLVSIQMWLKIVEKCWKRKKIVQRPSTEEE